jgi:hypothetical protein
MHLAEVIRMALHQPLPPRKRKFIEVGWVQEEPAYPIAPIATGASLLLAGSYLLLQSRDRKGAEVSTPAALMPK